MILLNKALEGLRVAQSIFTTGKNPGWSIPAGNRVLLYITVVIPIERLSNRSRNGLFLIQLFFTDAKGRHHPLNDFQHIQNGREEQGTLKRNILKCGQTEVCTNTVSKERDVLPMDRNIVDNLLQFLYTGLYLTEGCLFFAIAMFRQIKAEDLITFGRGNFG